MALLSPLSHCDFIGPLRTPVFAIAFGNALVEINHFVTLLFQESRNAPAIHSHLIGADHDGVATLHIVQATAGWAITHQEFTAIGDDECGFHHQTEVGDDSVDVLVELVARVPQQAIPVFHGHGGLAKIVILDRRNTDHLGRIFEWLIEHPPGIGDGLSANVKLLKIAVLRQNQLGAGSQGGFSDLGLEEAAFRIVDRIIANTHFAGTGCETHFHHGGDRIRLTGGCEVGVFVKRDVRLDHHNVALGDEFLDPTHGLKGRFKHAPGLSF